MPGTSNFLVWDPALTNSENDAAYLADSLRGGGAPANAILPSPTFNKFAYQNSTFVSAFCQMMANKGYTVSDANYTNLITALANVRTNADSIPLIQTVTYATSITLDATVAPAFDLTLTGNVSASSLANLRPGQVLTFILVQDATGSRTFSWPSGVTIHGTISPSANSINIQTFIVRADGVTINPLSPMETILASGVVIFTGLLPVDVNISTTGTVTAGNLEIFEKVTAAGGTVTRTLYTAIGAKSQKIRIKKTDSSTNAVICAAQGGQTIDGQNTAPITIQNNSLSFQSDGANWLIY